MTGLPPAAGRVLWIAGWVGSALRGHGAAGRSAWGVTRAASRAPAGRSGRAAAPPPPTPRDAGTASIAPACSTNSAYTGAAARNNTDPTTPGPAWVAASTARRADHGAGPYAVWCTLGLAPLGGMSMIRGTGTEPSLRAVVGEVGFVPEPLVVGQRDRRADRTDISDHSRRLTAVSTRRRNRQCATPRRALSTAPLRGQRHSDKERPLAERPPSQERSAPSGQTTMICRWRSRA